MTKAKPGWFKRGELLGQAAAYAQLIAEYRAGHVTEEQLSRRHDTIAKRFGRKGLCRIMEKARKMAQGAKT